MENSKNRKDAVAVMPIPNNNGETNKAKSELKFFASVESDLEIKSVESIDIATKNTIG